MPSRTLTETLALLDRIRELQDQQLHPEQSLCVAAPIGECAQPMRERLVFVDRPDGTVGVLWAC